MEHIVHVSEVSPPRPSSIHPNESLTKKPIDSPVTTQVSHDYSLLPSNNSETQLPPLRQEMHPLPIDKKIANAAPLGLCAFALTSFLTNCINLGVGDVQAAGASVSLALIYGGLVQILVGMWEMAVGNTFGATTFTSFGAAWVSFALTSTFESTNAVTDAANATCQNETLTGLINLSWFIFTTLMLLCTLKSSLAMFSLFFFLDMNYLLLGIAHIECSSQGQILMAVQKAGAVCGILAAFSAWWSAFAGVCDPGNGFFTVPLGHFPWSPAAHAHRAKPKIV
ncbi:hypothetical protein N7452_010965 [Penicillium brevicompactum]|uniref:Uncharacterized protein n=1 Tax=Penicillium brevicompactum TaxID=5074 RepID=A0A9W9Q163_PENBR|nr:hypothetical protein N7452_010965 [Penicillium brevicompactum]